MIRLHFQSMEDGLIGESPYIGKGRFRQEMLARQRGQGDAELQERQREHEALDRELEEKKQSIERGKLKAYQFENFRDKRIIMRKGF